MIRDIRITKQAQKDLLLVPRRIHDKLLSWVASVEEQGLEETRKRPGYHDEGLKGKRAGQRSIRLNKDYRAIYTIRNDGTVEFIAIEEVNKHDYRN